MPNSEQEIQARIANCRCRMVLVLRIARRYLASPRGYRQAEMLALASIGLSDPEIALALKTSPETIGTHWQRVLLRLKARTRTEAIAILLEHELGRRLDKTNEN